MLHFFAAVLYRGVVCCQLTTCTYCLDIYRVLLTPVLSSTYFTLCGGVVSCGVVSVGERGDGGEPDKGDAELPRGRHPGTKGPAL